MERSRQRWREAEKGGKKRTKAERSGLCRGLLTVILCHHLPHSSINLIAWVVVLIHNTLKGGIDKKHVNGKWVGSKARASSKGEPVEELVEEDLGEDDIEYEML